MNQVSFAKRNGPSIMNEKLSHLWLRIRLHALDN